VTVDFNSTKTIIPSFYHQLFKIKSTLHLRNQPQTHLSKTVCCKSKLKLWIYHPQWS